MSAIFVTVLSGRKKTFWNTIKGLWALQCTIVIYDYVELPTGYSSRFEQRQFLIHIKNRKNIYNVHT